jgi:2-isopropylmalate synthase
MKTRKPSSRLRPKARSAAGTLRRKATAGAKSRRKTVASKAAATSRLASDLVPSKEGADLIHDWNADGAAPRQPFGFVDETLRDGLQCPSVTDPSVEKKIEILRLMVALGIDAVDIGLPGAGGVVNQHVERLLRVIKDESLPIEPNCAARTVVRDIAPVAEIQQRVGHRLAVSMFIGSSAIRQYAEDWTLDKMVKASEEALAFARKEGIPILYVTEDTTRARPETIERLYGLAMDYGAERLIVCDTCGHVTPSGVKKLIAFVQSLVKRKKSKAKIEWHGHMDRGLGVMNSIAAIEAGVDRVHGCGLGIGERAGNTPLDLLLVNLKLMGWIRNDLSRLGDYCRAVASAVEVEIPYNYPVFGKDAFETGTGVHASAVIKALKKGDAWLANRVYSGVPSDLFGLSQKIAIGPMSGRSNVEFWFEQRGLPRHDAAIDAILARAKGSRKLLTDAEIESAVRDAMAAAGS